MESTWNKLLWTICAAFALLVATAAYSATREDPPFDYLVGYYQQATNGLIRPTVPNPAPGTPPEKLFTLDVEAYNAATSSQDFMEAKESFYARRTFDNKTQQHDRPYYYHSSWRSLFYPPIEELKLPLEVYDRRMAPFDPSQAADSRFFDPEFQRRLDSISGTELTSGNKLHLLPNGESFKEKLRMVRDAKKYFFGVVMVYFCDDSTKFLLDELIRKKKEGVDVRMMVEGLWGRTVASPCVIKMKKAGIPVTYIMDFFKKKSFVSVMHHKVWIRDGEEAIIGGQNMHQNSNYATGFNRHTRDTDVHFQSGPGVTDMLREYVALWHMYAKGASKKSIEPYYREIADRTEHEKLMGQRGQQNYDRWFSQPETRMNGVCRVLFQSSGGTYQQIAPVLAEMVKVTRDRLILTSPGVGYSPEDKKPDRWPQKLARIIKAQARDWNIRVDFLANGLEGGSGELAYVLKRMEKEIENQNLPFLPSLLQAINASQSRSAGRKDRVNLLDLAKASPNIHAWTYFEFLHAKTWMFDRTAVSVGSMNFDDFSTEKSHESTAICMDRALSSEFERQITLDLVNSLPVVSVNE